MKTLKSRLTSLWLCLACQQRIFPAVWWITIAVSFRRCDWLFPPSAREFSPGNRSNYKSTRERVDSKGLYGRWRLHLMGSWPRSHFKSRLSLIVRVNVVLNGTVVVDSDWRFDNLCGSHLQNQSELYYVSWCYYSLVIDLIGQLRRDVISRLSVKPWCYWLWRLKMNCFYFEEWQQLVRPSERTRKWEIYLYLFR